MPGSSFTQNKHISKTDERFRSSPLENALRNLRYKSQRERTIPLCGMQLSRPIDRSVMNGKPTTYTLPMVFKTVETCNDDNVFLRLENNNPAITSAFTSYREDYIPLESAFYRKFLLKSHTECIESDFDHPGSGYRVAKNDAEIKASVDNCYQRYSPQSIDTFFSHSRGYQGGPLPPKYPEFSIAVFNEKISEYRNIDPNDLPRFTNPEMGIDF